MAVLDQLLNKLTLDNKGTSGNNTKKSIELMLAGATTVTDETGP
jgi:hypothetical protein